MFQDDEWEYNNDPLRKLRDTFNSFDDDEDGFIDAKEISAAMSLSGIQVDGPSLKEMIASVDVDRNGKLDFNEFVTLTKNLPPPGPTSEELMDAFKEIDKDGNKYITLRELRQALASSGQVLTEDELNEIIKEVDVDGDGQINYEEFVKMME